MQARASLDRRRRTRKAALAAGLAERLEGLACVGFPSLQARTQYLERAASHCDRVFSLFSEALSSLALLCYSFEERQQQAN